MSEAINQISGHMNALNAQMALKANEIANRQTPGMHKSDMVWQSDKKTPMTVQVFPHDESSIKSTGRQSDIAIVGKRYFAVEVNGTMMASQHGAFAINAAGRLVDINGYELVTDRPYRLESSTFSVEIGGQIKVDNTVIARIVTFSGNDIQWDAATNPHYFPVGDAKASVANSGFVQGFLNGSHIDINQNITDIVRLKNAYRLNSEAIQKLYETDEKIIDGL